MRRGTRRRARQIVAQRPQLAERQHPLRNFGVRLVGQARDGQGRAASAGVLAR